jgi:transcriptional regulator with XRE-family HTH domain
MYDVARLKREMIEQGHSKSRLAKKAGMPESTVRAIFTRLAGSPENIKRLADALDIPMALLVKGRRRKEAVA